MGQAGRADVLEAGGDAELAPGEKQKERHDEPDQRAGDVPGPGLVHVGKMDTGAGGC